MLGFRRSTSHTTIHNTTKNKNTLLLLQSPLRTPERTTSLLYPHPHAPSDPRFFSTSSHLLKKTLPLPPRPTLPSDDITHVYLKGSGPGGQKINKTNSAAQLTHLPTGIVVKSQATRSRTQNYNIARRILAEKVELLEKGDESRVMKRQAFDRKKKASKSKKSRRKYRALEEGRAEGEGEGEGQDLEEGEEGEGELGPEEDGTSGQEVLDSHGLGRDSDAGRVGTQSPEAPAPAKRDAERNGNAPTT